MQYPLVIILLWLFTVCHLEKKGASDVQSYQVDKDVIPQRPILCGADRLSLYLPDLKNKRVAMVVNHTARVGATHLVDTLLRHNIRIQIIMAPEHGFRGDADAGEFIKDGRDAATGIRLLSLYGEKKKPSAEDLKEIDLVIFDIQDVGARFYTYISTLKYVMEACAAYQIPMIVLDRPNPNGHYIDGPLLDMRFSSFVGLLPIPVVHGMTVGELARMIKHESWIPKADYLDLKVIPCEGYDHHRHYSLPIKPSPNLPNDRAVLLYPTLCFFEGTIMSMGRGTDFPFQVLGHPDYPHRHFSFIPQSRRGAQNPVFKNQVCYGIDLTNLSISELFNRKKIDLNLLIQIYEEMPDKEQFFLKNGFFDKLAGTDKLRKAIQSGMSAEKIRQSWEQDLNVFKTKRKKYLLYPDFE